MNNLLEIFNDTIKFSWNHDNKETDTEWGAEVIDSTLFLRFDETKTKRDWFHNFMAWKNFYFRKKKKAYKNMPVSFRVHAGFLKKYKSIREEIFSYITENVKRVRITGFSQGAALALLAFEDIWFNEERLRDSIGGIGFACPRVVSVFAPSKRWEHFIRVSNGNDAVTKVPPKLLFYKHVGRDLFVGEKRKWWKLKPSDHFAKNYRKALEEYEPK